MYSHSHWEGAGACFCCTHILVNGQRMGRTLHIFPSRERAEQLWGLINTIDALMAHFYILNTGGKYIPFCKVCGSYDSLSIDSKKAWKITCLARRNGWCIMPAAYITELLQRRGNYPVRTDISLQPCIRILIATEFILVWMELYVINCYNDFIDFC